MARELRATRYLTTDTSRRMGEFIQNELRFMDFEQTVEWYNRALPFLDLPSRALLGCNDRFFLLTGLLGRVDAVHPWLFDRCREVEADPDGHIDLWARFHYKSTIITFAGAIQEILIDPEITIGIFSVVKPIAQEFLSQIKEEFESNDTLKDVYADVLFREPKKKNSVEGRPAKWGIARGITVRRRGNPKEATIEAHGLIDGQPTGRHFKLHIYDDVVTQDHIAEDQIKKTTARWEMADNLGSHTGVRKWVVGTPYHFADTYVQIINRKSLKPRKYPVTDDGTMNGTPVFLTATRWAEIKRDQKSTVSAQMLLNPVAGNDATFKSTWFKTYDVIPSVMNVYIMVDPSKGASTRSDRTAIAVIGIDVHGNKFLIDGVCHRMKLTDRWHFLKTLHEKWQRYPGVQMVKVGYEQYGKDIEIEVIEGIQRQEKVYFELEEMGTPRRGKHSKNDRIERLEPDIRGGSFYFPCLIHNPDHGGSDGLCFWSVWTEEDAKKFKLKADADGEPDRKCNYFVGQIIYRPARGPTRLQRWCADTGQKFRIVTPIKRRDENNDIYDLTRSFLLEAMEHPFAQHDDLIDAAARIYDLEPEKPQQYETSATEPVSEDSYGIPQHLDA